MHSQIGSRAFRGPSLKLCWLAESPAKCSRRTAGATSEGGRLAKVLGRFLANLRPYLGMTSSYPALDVIGERFWRKVDKAGPLPEARPDLGPCWLWLAATDRDGYGVFGPTHGKADRAHHFLVGKPPTGLTYDHLCRRRSCVRPSHLELVTNKVNVLRGAGITAQNALKTHCLRGHAFDEANTRIWRGERYCRTCHCEAMRARRAR